MRFVEASQAFANEVTNVRGEHGVVPPQDSAAGSGPFWPFFVVGPASVMAAAWVVVLVWLGVEVAKYAKPPGAEREAK